MKSGKSLITETQMGIFDQNKRTIMKFLVTEK